MMDELEFLSELKDKIGQCEFEGFHRRIVSLKSNLVYWPKRLSHESASERAEAKSELARCEDLLRLVMKDMVKAKQKAT
jgi:hypothetical protein